jgi:hypothetical protein
VTPKEIVSVEGYESTALEFATGPKCLGLLCTNYSWDEMTWHTNTFSLKSAGVLLMQCGSRMPSLSRLQGRR